MMDRAFRGIWIPAEIWESKDLSITEKVMLVEIDSLCNDPEKGCYKNNSSFAKFFDLSESRVSEIISSLKDKGFIRVEYKRQGSKIVGRNIFMVNRHERPEFKEKSSETKENHRSENTSGTERESRTAPAGKTERHRSENTKESNTSLGEQSKGLRETPIVPLPAAEPDYWDQVCPSRGAKNRAQDLRALDWSSWPCLPSIPVMTQYLKVCRSKSPMTQLVLNNFAPHLQQLHQVGVTVDAALTEAITAGWQGLKYNWIAKRLGLPVFGEQQAHSVQRFDAHAYLIASDKAQLPANEGILDAEFNRID